MTTYARPIKIGGNRNYVDEVSMGFPELPAKELDDDLNMLYDAANRPIEMAGPAGGDLTGTYPNPTLRPDYIAGLSPAFTAADATKVLAIDPTGTSKIWVPAPPSQILDSSVTTPKIADASVTDAKITEVSWGKITGEPTAFPPSGPAGGDLAGTYPNPTIASVGWSKVTGAPATYPPSGAAGGDLVGTYPNPTLRAGLVFPPVGAAGGDLTGGYPNPTIGPLKVTTAALANLAVTNAKVNDVAWAKITGAPTTFPASGPAGGSLTGTYPNPTIATGAVTNVMHASGASIRYANAQNLPVNWSTTLNNAWQPLVQYAGIYIGGGYVLIQFAASGLLYAGSGGNVWFRIVRDATNVWQMILKLPAYSATPPWDFIDWSVPTGTHTYNVDIQVSAGGWVTDAAAVNNGYVVLWNLS